MAPYPENASRPSCAASACGRSASPAAWCCLPIWSAISSTMRSATSRWRRWRPGSIGTSLFWQFLPVTILFYTACVVHTALGIWALYERRQFRWKAIEPLQLVLGLSMPMLIIAHVIGIRLGQTLFGHEKLYPQVLFLYWIWAPYRVWMMLAVMTIAWVHGCIGLYFWLRMRAFYKRAAPFLLATAVLIPTLAMLGFYQGGRMVIDSDSIEWRAENLSESQVGTRPKRRTLERITDYFLYRLSRPDRPRAAGPRRARHQRAPPRHDQPVLRQRPHRAGAEGPQRARGEPAQQRAPCQRLRRPRALLDLPHPHHRRPQRAARALAARGLRARPGRRAGSVDPPRLPVAADLRSLVLPAVPAAHDVGRRRTNRTRRGSARSVISSACSSTCAARPSLRRSACRSTPSSSSTASSARCRRRCSKAAARPNQFVGDGMLALFGLVDQPAGSLPPGAARGGA